MVDMFVSKLSAKSWFSINAPNASQSSNHDSMVSSHFLLLLLFLLLQVQPFSSMANLQKINTLLKSNLTEQINHTLTGESETPVYFEVTEPFKVPKTEPCSLRILQHQFKNTFYHSPIFADYNLPVDCPSQEFSKIVLEWTATCNSNQLHRIFGVWLDGVEILRSSTPRVLPDGAMWTAKKDITRYNSLLTSKKTQQLGVFLGNQVDEKFTGVYDVTITFKFYPGEKKPSNYHLGNTADLILPISLDLSVNDGLWFEVKNSTHYQSKQFKIPQNVYKAVLEVYVSYHENDEFWFSNLHNDYISENNLQKTRGNGPFREVIVKLDDKLVGAVWPFTVIYNGFLNTHLWRPITGIGSFDFPSYDIDITPFLGTILDGENHQISFGVTDALNVWYIDANLHLWLDPKSSKTEGKLLTHEVPNTVFSYKPNIKGLNAQIEKTGTRSVSTSGWVQSSYGKIESRFIQELHFTNTMALENDGRSKTVDQLITFDQKSYDEFPSSNAPLLTESLKRYTIFFKINHLYHIYSSKSSVTLLFEEKKSKGENHNLAFSSLHNIQQANGDRVLKDGKTVTSGSTEQKYNLVDVDGSCYSRNVKNENNVLHDTENSKCDESMSIH